MAHNLWFVTFGDSRLKEAHVRIRHQAEKMGVFADRIRILDESDLDAAFCEKMKNHLIPGSRGYGYWCWKPQVILQVLREMPEGDVLLYADIGCHLNPNGLARLEEYRQFAIRHGVVAFQSRALGDEAKDTLALHFLPERQWTKMDLLHYYGLDGRKDVLDSGQIGAGMALFKNNDFACRLVTKWRQCYYDHFEFIDDTPSTLPNAPDFVESGHDQSVFSLLCKKHGAFLLSSGEYVRSRCCMPEGGDKRIWPEYWKDLAHYPVHARRDLGKYTKFVECPDWLKPILGKRGRRWASALYEKVKALRKRLVSAFQLSQ